MNHRFIESTALISNDPQVIEQIQGCFETKELVEVISSSNETDILSIELPELIIVDFTDWELAFTVLDRIIADPWLHYQNIITISSSYDVDHRIEGHKAVNLLAAVSRYDILRDIPVILNIIRKNGALMFHRGYETDVFDKIAGNFTLNNSLLEIEALINLICSYLYNANKLDTSRKNRLKTALTELFVNAMEHGNYEIGYDEKAKWLESGKKIEDLMEKKGDELGITNREIRFSYEINRDYSDFIIEDDGKGFNWHEFLEPSDDNSYTHYNGRGIIMAHTSSSRLEYNESGNRVKCSIDHKELSSNSCPAVLSHLKDEYISEGTTILKQGDRSSYLYFISKGRYLVSVDDKPVSILTPDDIFMGEMSFLLNGKRSASITALSEGTVIRISKREFISVIREYPYYTLFLARLLARRLSKSNS